MIRQNIPCDWGSPSGVINMGDHVYILRELNTGILKHDKTDSAKISV